MPEELPDLSYAELKKLRDKIETLMAKKLEEEHATFRQEVSEAAIKLGIPPDVLFK